MSSVKLKKESDTKKLISNLFSYVKEIKDRLDTPVLNEKNYEWILNLEGLADHPYIFKQQTTEYFFKIKRPKFLECPFPPPEIIEWIKPSWKYIEERT